MTDRDEIAQIIAAWYGSPSTKVSRLAELILSSPWAQAKDAAVHECSDRWTEIVNKLVAEKDAQIARLEARCAELEAALKEVRHSWAGHSERCAHVLTKYRALCDCDWPKIAARIDAALASTSGKSEARERVVQAARAWRDIQTGPETPDVIHLESAASILLVSAVEALDAAGGG